MWTGTSAQTCRGTWYWEECTQVRFPVRTSPQAYYPSGEMPHRLVHYYPPSTVAS